VCGGQPRDTYVASDSFTDLSLRILVRAPDNPILRQVTGGFTRATSPALLGVNARFHPGPNRLGYGMPHAEQVAIQVPNLES
jgi:hypothetical protein